MTTMIVWRQWPRSVIDGKNYQCQSAEKSSVRLVTVSERTKKLSALCFLLKWVKLSQKVSEKSKSSLIFVIWLLVCLVQSAVKLFPLNAQNTWWSSNGIHWEMLELYLLLISLTLCTDGMRQLLWFAETKFSGKQLRHHLFWRLQQIRLSLTSSSNMNSTLWLLFAKVLVNKLARLWLMTSVCL